jgi:hypothetical protein
MALFFRTHECNPLCSRVDLAPFQRCATDVAAQVQGVVLSGRQRRVMCSVWGGSLHSCMLRLACVRDLVSVGWDTHGAGDQQTATNPPTHMHQGYASSSSSSRSGTLWRSGTLARSFAAGRQKASSGSGSGFQGGGQQLSWAGGSVEQQLAQLQVRGAHYVACGGCWVQASRPARHSAPNARLQIAPVQRAVRKTHTRTHARTHARTMRRPCRGARHPTPSFTGRLRGSMQVCVCVWGGAWCAGWCPWAAAVF